MKKMFYLSVSALVCLICLIPAALASEKNATIIGSGYAPSVDGNWATWVDEAGSVHLYNLSAGTDYNLNNSGASSVTVDDDTLVWRTMNKGKPIFVVNDICGHSCTSITENVDNSSVPAISGNKVVWSVSNPTNNYDSDIYMRDLYTGVQRKIATGDNPDIDGTKVVFTHSGDDMPQVYVYDYIDKKTQPVSDNGGHFYNPHISGDKVIWSNLYTRMGWIDMGNLITGNVTNVTSDGQDSGNLTNPDCGCDTGYCSHISGDRIVYSKVSNDCLGKPGVYIYTISTGVHEQIFESGNSTTTPDIDGDVVVWGMTDVYNEERKMNHDIYLYRLD